MTAFLNLLIFILGLVIGSFLGACTYRIPRGKSVKFGRSYCPRCKKTISWYDNIPLFSYIFLKGKCRKCNKKISLRYPFIESATALIFLALAKVSQSCLLLAKSSVLCEYHEMLGTLTLPYLLLIASFFIVIFVIDLEHKIIIDESIFALFGITFLILLLFSPATLYIRLLCAFAASTFLLLINLATRGRGMGLGDVKFALLGGLILGWPATLVWLYVSFVVGAVVGLVLILFKKAEFGKHVPFGPFLVASFFIAFIWGDFLAEFFFRFLKV